MNMLGNMTSEVQFSIIVKVMMMTMMTLMKMLIKDLDSGTSREEGLC